MERHQISELINTKKNKLKELNKQIKEDKKRVYDKNYYHTKLKKNPKHRAKVLRKAKLRYQEIKEDPVEYQKLLDRSRLTSKKYRKAHREEIRQYALAKYHIIKETDPEKYQHIRSINKKTLKEFYAKNRDKILKENREKYATMKQTNPEKYQKMLAKQRICSRGNYEKLKQDPVKYRQKLDRANMVNKIRYHKNKVVENV